MTGAAEACPGVVELHLLLPSREAASLEAAAHERGLTTAQFLRRLCRGFLQNLTLEREGCGAFGRLKNL